MNKDGNFDLFIFTANIYFLVPYKYEEEYLNFKNGN